MQMRFKMYLIGLDVLRWQNKIWRLYMATTMVVLQKIVR